MRYCCDLFEINFREPGTSAPGIRVVKYLPHPWWDHKPAYGYYITIGYTTFSVFLPKLTIRFCPFCGTNLRDFYADTDLHNEAEGTSF